MRVVNNSCDPHRSSIGQLFQIILSPALCLVQIVYKEGGRIRFLNGNQLISRFSLYTNGSNPCPGGLHKLTRRLSRGKTEEPVWGSGEDILNELSEDEAQQMRQVDRYVYIEVH